MLRSTGRLIIPSALFAYALLHIYFYIMISTGFVEWSFTWVFGGLTKMLDVQTTKYILTSLFIIIVLFFCAAAYKALREQPYWGLAAFSGAFISLLTVFPTSLPDKFLFLFLMVDILILVAFMSVPEVLNLLKRVFARLSV